VGIRAASPHCLVAHSSFGSVDKKIASHIQVFDKSARTDAYRADVVSDMSMIATSVRLQFHRS